MQNNSSSADRIREKKKLFLAREQRIIDAAIELFLEESIDRITVSKIAVRAGIGKGTVYKHFLTKNEILIRIILDYEQNITEKLTDGIKRADTGDSGAAAKSYFEARLENPQLDRLVQQLEDRLVDSGDVADQAEELYQLRRSNEDALTGLTTKLIDRGVLEDVPPHFHYLACWALAQGAVELCFNKTWNYRTDTSELMEFISNIGVTMGNQGQYHPDDSSSTKSKSK
ncbi:TetR/AcrR family transcriptional regulator [Porticoccaceae bacterium]|jgi:TetR/AcrR family transcriptional regulator|nr:TetR/AcrR family transcriptional regulator [Porticoccaceae bacterium]MDA9014544.1 TetR/AcrR family transcriptional regulator [Porticoccaceae bacterium]